MSTGLYKGMVLGLVAGLIIGVTGGYYGKNLDAQAPLGTTINSSTESNSTVEALTKVWLDTAITNAIEENGFKDVFGLDSDSGSVSVDHLRILPTMLSGIGILGTAMAQKEVPPCTESQFNLIEIMWEKAGESFFEKAPCMKSVTLEGVITYKLYQGLDKDGNTLGINKVEYSFIGTYTQVRINRDKCEEVVETFAVNSGPHMIIWDGKDVIRHEEAEDRGVVDWELICEDKEKITWTFNNPNFDKEKCCGPTGGEEEGI